MIIIDNVFIGRSDSVGIGIGVNKVESGKVIK